MVAAVLTAVLTAAAPTSADAAPAGVTSTLVNFDGSGQSGPANHGARFDVDGGNLDAEEGQISEFVDPATNSTTFVLYGESHACGFQWTQHGTPFCGFNAYTSTDLVHWTKRGKLFDPSGVLGANARTSAGHSATTTWQSLCNGEQFGCFRPHVIFNSATHKFVLWFYAAVDQHFFVMTSDSPYKDFALSVDGPSLDVGVGDHYLFVDPTSTANPPAAYLAHTFADGLLTIGVSRLNSTYDGVDGPTVPTHVKALREAPGLANDYGIEAPAMFERSVAGTPVYFLTYSDPHCGYGDGCGASYVWSLSPTGPWGPGPVDTATPPIQASGFTTGTSLNANSCGGQPTAVSPFTQADGSTGYLFQSDLNRWSNGTPNQGVSNFYWTPLAFDAGGSPQPFNCTATSTVSL
jgi:hypothetical protein